MPYRGEQSLTACPSLQVLCMWSHCVLQHRKLGGFKMTTDCGGLRNRGLHYSNETK